MKNIPKNIDWSLLMKIISSNSTIKENDQFEAWIKTDIENELFFIKVKEIWTQSKKESVNIDAALNAVKNKIKFQNTTRTSDRHSINPIWNRFTKIAASLLFLVGTLFIIFQQKNKSSIQLLSISTELNERLNITLPDSTKVFLNSGSKISYPEKFTDDKRSITLNGEAYFDVTHNPHKPFIITTLNTKTVVLGTSFSLRAYSDESIEEIIVETGKISFGSSRTDDKIVLLPGDKGEYTKTRKILSKLKKKNSNQMSWKTRVMKFDKDSLLSVFSTLEKVYLTSFEVETAIINNCKLSARFDNQTLESIIEAIEMTFDIKIIKEESTYIVYGQGCK